MQSVSRNIFDSVRAEDEEEESRGDKTCKGSKRGSPTCYEVTYIHSWYAKNAHGASVARAIIPFPFSSPLMLGHLVFVLFFLLLYTLQPDALYSQLRINSIRNNRNACMTIGSDILSGKQRLLYEIERQKIVLSFPFHSYVYTIYSNISPMQAQDINIRWPQQFPRQFPPCNRYERMSWTYIPFANKKKTVSPGHCRTCV